MILTSNFQGYWWAKSAQTRRAALRNRRFNEADQFLDQTEGTPWGRENADREQPDGSEWEKG